MTGFLLFGSFIVLLILGVPIAVSLAMATMSAIIFSPDITLTLSVVTQRIFGGLDSTSIMAIAFFVLAGNIMTKGGISRRLVEFANCIVGGFRGGMSPATVVAIGVMLYPDMVRLGYSKERTAGLLVVAGGLGPIIPPSIIMVVYCTITGASVGKMFSAGMGIGFMIVAVLMATIIFYAHKEKWPKTSKKLTAAELGKSFFNAIPALILPIIILGGIYSGILTPTESAAAAVIWALIAGMFIYKEVKLRDLYQIFLESAKSSAMVLFIIATSTAFAWLFAFAGISAQLVAFVNGLNLSAATFCLITAFILLIFGTFLEGIATAVLMVPVMWPIAQSFGIDVIHFGMIVSISNVIGTMTPPVAVNIFSASSVSKLKMGAIAKGQMPFFIGYVAVFFLVVLFPQITALFTG